MTFAIIFTIMFIYLDLCICHSIKLQPRIIEGSPTTANKYPWMVSIQWSDKYDKSKRKHSCSGTLIRNTYPAAVLTAGHCVGQQIFGDTGRRYYADINRTYPYEVNRSDDKYITLRPFYYYLASSYSNGFKDNLLTDYDMGILLLDGSVEDIEPITLYNATNITHNSQCCLDNQLVRAFGYGYVNDNNIRTETLRYLDMQYMSNVYNCSELVIECVEETDGFSDTSYTDIVVNDGSAVCAYANGAGICQGDSGGPLVFYDMNDNIIQIGIGSQSCCIPGVPNMFATVEYFYDTIQQALDDEIQWVDYLNNSTDIYIGTDGFVSKIDVVLIGWTIVLGVLFL
eukprot:469506_1